jgi:hypothetical protein
MRIALLSLFFVLLAACGPAPTETPIADTPSVSEPTATTPAIATEDTGPSFDAEVYTDPEGRFEISFPVGWMVDDAQAGSRGGYVQITSWQHEPGGFSEVPEGAHVIQLATYVWDPVGDHAARLEMRRGNFESSGNVILEEEQIVFANDRVGTKLVMQATNGEISVVVLTVLGDQYLEISGNGPDTALLEEIISTFEFTN